MVALQSFIPFVPVFPGGPNDTSGAVSRARDWALMYDRILGPYLTANETLAFSVSTSRSSAGA